MSTAPIHHIDLNSFWADPYPALEQMRQSAPIAYVPELGGTLFVGRDDIFKYEKQIEVFSSLQPDGPMTRLMGENMMRKDGDPHLSERRDMFPSVSPRTVRDVWTQQFREATAAILDDLCDQGTADLVTAYAMPVSASALRAMTGLVSMSNAEMDWSSQAMIDGLANPTNDPEVEAECHRATAFIEQHIAIQRDTALSTPSHSILSVLLAAGQNEESIKANIKLAISGGQNEPRDAIAGTAFALMSNPAQLALIRLGEATWLQAFEEYARWTSPIGMAPRRIAKPIRIGDIELEPEDRVFLMFGAANRDPEYFDAADQFDITRDTSKHIAFGAGPHFCAGAWASKAMIADVALPMLFDRLPGLRLNPQKPATMGGWAFRGLQNLDVFWDV